MTNGIPVLRIRFVEWILDRKSWYYYLIPPDPYGKLKDIYEVPLDKGFFKVASRYMNAFIEKGEMPPEAIAPAIFNMMDDYAAGRQVVIRSGYTGCTLQSAIDSGGNHEPQ
jgi:hypothetical protein